VVAATNRHLDELVAAGQFREDLLYRLRVIHLHVPPLRERADDVLALLQHFLALAERDLTFTDEARRALVTYRWPGNVRELRNVVERAVILSSGEFLELKHLPPYVSEVPPPAPPPAGGAALTAGMTVEEAENRLILLTLDHARGNKTRAAEILGISLKTLHNKLNKMRGRASEETISS